jgi:mannitol-1-phosphate/altronate dehydrogenase
MHFIRRRTSAGMALVDPLGDRLAAVARERTTGDPAVDVAAFLSMREVFPGELADDPRFRGAVERAYSSLAAAPGVLIA